MIDSLSAPSCVRGSDGGAGVLQYAQSRRTHQPARFGLRAGKPCWDGERNQRGGGAVALKQTRREVSLPVLYVAHWKVSYIPARFGHSVLLIAFKACVRR